MTIQTKFNLGQEVFFLKNRKVCSGRIMKIEALLSILDARPCKVEKRCAFETTVIEEPDWDNVKFVQNVKYQVGTWWYNECFLRETEDELVNFVDDELETIEP